MGQETKKKELKKQRLKGLLIALGVIILLCGLATCGALISIPSTELPPTPTWAPFPTQMPTLAHTPTATTIPSPTTIPTPAYLTIAQITRERGALTDLQKEQYDQNILGNAVQFHGQVIEVYEDGRVQIDEGGLFAVVILLGIPKDEAVVLNKDQLIEGIGTIAECLTFLGVHIEIQVTSWDI